MRKTRILPFRLALKISPLALKTSLSAALLATGPSGCAFTYIDSRGDLHAIGLLDMTVRAAAAPATLAGDVVEITSLGLSLGQNAQGGYLTAGFNRQTTAALRDNALVIGNPVAALAPIDRQETGARQ
jgi:hypothetical protein